MRHGFGGLWNGLLQVLPVAIEDGDVEIDLPSVHFIAPHGTSAFEVRSLFSPIDAFGMEHIVFLGSGPGSKFGVREVGRGEHVEAVGGGVELPPKEVILYFAALRDDHDAGIEGGGFVGFEGVIKSGSEEAGGDGDDFLDVAVEPERSVFAFEVGEEERVFVTLAVGEAAADHFFAEEKGSLVEGVGKGSAVRALEFGGEVVEAATVDTDDDVGAAREVQAQGIFVILLHAASEVVFHLAHSIVPNSGGGYA